MIPQKVAIVRLQVGTETHAGSIGQNEKSLVLTVFTQLEAARERRKVVETGKRKLSLSFFGGIACGMLRR